LTVWIESDRQSHGAVHVQSLARLQRLIGGKFETLESLQQIGERDSGFGAGECGAQAKVNAVAKGDMRIGIAADIEAVRVCELAGIAVGRSHHGKHERSRGNHLAVHYDIAARRAHHPLQGGTVAEDFLDGRWQQVRLRERMDWLYSYDATAIAI